MRRNSQRAVMAPSSPEIIGIEDGKSVLNPGKARAQKFLHDLYAQQSVVPDRPVAKSRAISVDSFAPQLAQVEIANSEMKKKYKPKRQIDGSLNRGLVSFQANKSRAVYRWYKCKEAFSADLVENLFARYGLT